MEGRLLDLPINVWDHERRLSPTYLVTSFPIESADGCYRHECFSQTHFIRQDGTPSIRLIFGVSM